MKGQTLRRIVNWTAGAALLTGIAYSGLALSAKPVYASSCNCNEEQAEGIAFCEPYGGVYSFYCPVGDPARWLVTCNGGGQAYGEFCSGT